jgi:hypothetical protein
MPPGVMESGVVMSRIKVLRPFSLRLSRFTPPRAFTIGEHEISEKEEKNWFMQACIKDGWAQPVALSVRRQSRLTDSDSSDADSDSSDEVLPDKGAGLSPDTLPSPRKAKK